MTDAVGLFFVGLGLFFDLAGCIGLVRLPDVYNRLQAATKCVTLGTCLILFGAAVLSRSVPGGVLAMLCALFVLLASPVAAHALARASHVAGIRLWDKSVCDAYDDYEAAQRATRREIAR
jgi:multicomponent Na+:H+ antiporter subunit G